LDSFIVCLEKFAIREGGWFETEKIIRERRNRRLAFYPPNHNWDSGFQLCSGYLLIDSEFF
jgi:hypothetical protein